MSLQELKVEAKELGIDFSANIGEKKLQAKIDEFYELQETSGAEIEAAVEANEAEKANQEETNEKPAVTGKKGKRTLQDRAAQAKKEATATRVVTIIDNDQRVNNQTTTCTINCSNEYFDLGTRITPLNEPVELEQGFINSLREVKIPQHIKDPATGLSRITMRNRYTIS